MVSNIFNLTSLKPIFFFIILTKNLSVLKHICVGPKSSLTVAAQRMLNKCVERLGEKEDRLMRLEKAINPLLDDNDQVALTFILECVVSSKLKTMSESWPFLKPVNKKLVKDYYSIVKRPMDLETVSKKITGRKKNGIILIIIHRFFAMFQLINITVGMSSWPILSRFWRIVYCTMAKTLRLRKKQNNSLWLVKRLWTKYVEISSY